MKNDSIPKLNVSYLIAVTLLVSCINEKNKERKAVAIAPAVKTKPPGNFHDTLQISEPAAVFYYPDSLQLAKIKDVTDTNVFNSSMHEYFYQMRNARMVLKKSLPEIKIIDARNARYLLFIYKDNTKKYIDLDTKNDAYGLILFDRQKPPFVSDMSNIEAEAGLYFSK